VTAETLRRIAPLRERHGWSGDMEQRGAGDRANREPGVYFPRGALRARGVRTVERLTRLGGRTWVR